MRRFFMPLIKQGLGRILYENTGNLGKGFFKSRDVSS